nr:hypothetical protein [Bacillus pumilus]
MIRLIQNEWMKISYRIGTWIMVGLLVLGMIATLIFVVKTNDKDQASGDWQTRPRNDEYGEQERAQRDREWFF